jgi:hypothetical protein
VVWAVAAHTGTFYGQAMTAGDITSWPAVAPGSWAPADQPPRQCSARVNVAVSAAGSLLVTDSANNRLRAIAP